MSHRLLVLLGPQQRAVTLGGVLRTLAPEGSVATITAGWQDREAEDSELNEVLDGRGHNLSLYQRAERVWNEDPALRTAHKKIQNHLRLLRRAYQVQLDSAMDTWWKLERMDGEPVVLDLERQAAFNAIRELDARQLTRIAELREQYEQEVRPGDRLAVQRERGEIAEQIGNASAIAIAGGHVAVLLNRLRLFNVVELFAQKPIFAWSAGAMVLMDRVVLFHDSPPQGAGTAEMFDRGFALATDILPLPHARERLKLNDPARVVRLSRRFVPTRCVTLDHNEGIAKLPGGWSSNIGGDATLKAPYVLTPDGALEAFAA